MLLPTKVRLILEIYGKSAMSLRHGKILTSTSQLLKSYLTGGLANPVFICGVDESLRPT